MPKPIRMTEEMIEECFKDVRDTFEAAFAKAKADAESGKMKLANGKFEFKYPGVDYTWKDDTTKARLVVLPYAWDKIVTLVSTASKEIGWHGIIERNPENVNEFILKDILLFPQTVTGSTVDADPSKYPMWAMQLPDEVFNKMRFHGHSHVNMGVTPSSVDMNYRADLIKQYTDGFYVFMIVNKRFELEAQIYDFDENAFYECKEILFTLGNSEDRAKLKAEMSDMVKEFTYTPAKATTPPAPKANDSGYYPGQQELPWWRDSKK